MNDTANRNPGNGYSEELLILYYYRDGLDEATRSGIAAALQTDAGLRRRYDALCRDLDDMAGAGDLRAPGHAVARWHDSIERAAAAERRRPAGRRWRLHVASFAWGSAVAAALAIGIGLGIFVSGRDAGGPAHDAGLVADAAPPADTSSAFVRALQVHFRQSRDDIGRLPVDAAAEREMLILHIVQQNRLFAREAAEHDAMELARVLRAFEPVLVRLAAGDLQQDEAAKLQTKLTFELGAMLTKLDRPPSNSTESI